MEAPIPPLRVLLEHEGFAHDLARRLMQDEEAAHDVAQDTWLAASRALPTGDRPLRPWLARVARRFALRERRRQVARADRERRAAQQDEVPSAEEIVAREEQRQALVRAVLQLPKLSREVILLRYFEGLPPREIARHLELGVATVKTRLKRGLAELRGRLARCRPEGSAGLALLAAGRGEPVGRWALWKLVVMTLEKNVLLAALSVLLLAAAGIGGLGWLAGGDSMSGGGEDAPAPPLGAGTARAAPDVPSSSREALRPEALGPALRGHVVVRGEGTPVAGVQVWPSWSYQRQTPALVTDAEGGFELELDSPALLSTLEVGVGVSTVPTVAEVTLPLVPGEGHELTIEVSRGTTVHGRVVDEEGRPVQGARVLGWCREEAEGPPHRMVLADLSGEFELAGIGPEMWLEARGPANGPPCGPATVVTGRLGDVSEAGVFVLRVASERILHGRVFSMGGGPLAGVRVSIPAWAEMHRSLTPHPRVFNILPDGGDTLSLSDGSFALTHTRGLRPRITASLTGFQIWEGSPAVGEMESGMDITLAPSLEFRGRVLASDGSPVADAEVTLHTRRPVASTRSAEDGSFILQGLSPQRDAWLGGHADGHAIMVLEHVSIPHGGQGPVELRLAPARRLSGVVRWPDGSAAHGVRVSIEGDHVLAPRFQSGVSHPNTWEWEILHTARTTTDDDGHFAFHDLYEGIFEVQVAYGEEPVRRQWWNLRSGEDAVALTLDPAVVQDTIFEGVVRDAFTGQPVTDFEARAIGIRDGLDFNGPVAGFHSAEGRFQLEGIQPATMRVMVNAEGYARGSSAWKDYPAGRQQVQVALSPGRTLLVRVVDHDGNPVEGVTVMVSASSGSWWIPGGRTAMVGSTRTDSAGETILHGLPAERITLWMGTFRPDRSWTFDMDLAVPVEGYHEFRVDLDDQEDEEQE